jgi:hypothetical protein
VLPAGPPPLMLPPGLVSLAHLPSDHPAAHYICGRGYDVGYLSAVWELASTSLCDPQRIAFPIYATSPPFANLANVEPTNFVLAGWQARAIEPIPEHVPKYIFPPGMQKSRLLYGLRHALNTTSPVIVCEGATDVWRVGPGAVAILGSSMSEQQRQLLLHYFAGRPIVVLLDADAQQHAEQLRQQLAAGRLHVASGDNRIVIARLPAHRKDPGEATREEIAAAIGEALSPRPLTNSL